MYAWWMTLLGQRVGDAKELFVVLCDLGGLLQGEPGLEEEEGLDQSAPPGCIVKSTEYKKVCVDV